MVLFFWINCLIGEVNCTLLGFHLDCSMNLTGSFGVALKIVYEFEFPIVGMDIPPQPPQVHTWRLRNKGETFVEQLLLRPCEQKCF